MRGADELLPGAGLNEAAKKAAHPEEVFQRRIGAYPSAPSASIGFEPERTDALREPGDTLRGRG